MYAFDKFNRIKSRAQEIIVEEELLSLLSNNGRPRAYIGFEPSGLLHVGNFLLTSSMINTMLDCNFDVTVLLADWHAYINDKLGGDMERIRQCGEYMRASFNYACREHGNINFLFASDLLSKKEYLEELIRNAKRVSLSRLKRSLTIMGRTEDEAELDFSKLVYPLMQVTDIFMLDVNVAYAGMDQRRAHMLAREIAEQSKRAKPIAVHTPILSSLKGGSRMDPLSKMSKSDPSGAIYLQDDEETIASKLRNAFCPKEVEGNPVLDICKYLIFPELGSLEIVRSEKHGGNVLFSDYLELQSSYLRGGVHPLDLKTSVASALWKIVKKYHDFYASNPSLFDWMEGGITR